MCLDSGWRFLSKAFKESLTSLNLAATFCTKSLCAFFKAEYVASTASPKESET